MDRIFGDAISDIGTDQLYPIGTERTHIHATYGEQIYRYIKVDTGVTAEIGLACMIKNGSTTPATGVVLAGTATPRARCRGIFQHVITAAYYGWVLRKGWGIGQSDGTTTADTAQTCAANGELTNGTIGTNEMVCFAAETEDPAGAGGLFVCYVDCP